MFEANEAGMIVKLGASIIDAYRLEPDPELVDSPMSIGSASAKVSTVLSCAQVLAAHHFPLLTKATWSALLSCGEDFLSGIFPAAQILSPGFLTRSEYFDFDDLGLSDEEMDALASLSSVQLFAVHIVIDRFLSQAIDQEEDVRATLAFISKRQPEFVFKDDVEVPILRPVT